MEHFKDLNLASTRSIRNIYHSFGKKIMDIVNLGGRDLAGSLLDKQETDDKNLLRSLHDLKSVTSKLNPSAVEQPTLDIARVQAQMLLRRIPGEDLPPEIVIDLGATINQLPDPNIEVLELEPENADKIREILPQFD